MLAVRHKGRNGIKTEGCYVRKEAEMEDAGGKSRGLVSGRAEALEHWAWGVSQARGQTAVRREPNLAVVPVYPAAFRNRRSLLTMENRTS